MILVAEICNLTGKKNFAQIYSQEKTLKIRILILKDCSYFGYFWF